MRTAREWGVYVGEVVVLLALELSAKSWRLVMGASGRRRHVTLEPGNAKSFVEALSRARVKFGLPEDAPVVSCYEAGRDGFWVHRWLAQHGVRNVVIDSASIEVSRRARRAKTDRVDGEKLWTLLHRWYGGDAEALRPVRVPSREEEGLRLLHRERQTWVTARTREGNRIRSSLDCPKRRASASGRQTADCSGSANCAAASAMLSTPPLSVTVRESPHCRSGLYHVLSLSSFHFATHSPGLLQGRN